MRERSQSHICKCTEKGFRMKIVLAQMAMVFVCFVSTGCSNVDVNDPPANAASIGKPVISGRVLDQNGRPIRDVVISAYGKITSTNDSGVFALKGIGDLPLRVIIQTQRDSFAANAFAFTRYSDTSSVYSEVVLIRKIKIATISSASDTVVAWNGYKISIPASDTVNKSASTVDVFVSVPSAADANFSKSLSGGDRRVNHQGVSDFVIDPIAAFNVELVGQSIGPDIVAAAPLLICEEIPESAIGSTPDSIDVWTFEPVQAIWTYSHTEHLSEDRRWFCTTSNQGIWYTFGKAVPAGTVSGKVCNEEGNLEVQIGNISTYTNGGGVFTALIPAETKAQKLQHISLGVAGQWILIAKRQAKCCLICRHLD